MKEAKTLLIRGEDGKAKQARRVKVGDERSLYYGETGTEPCHYCAQEVGQPHLIEALCDHEECPLCGGQLLGCSCEVAEFYGEVGGKLAGRRRKFGAWGFTAEEAEAAAGAKYDRAAAKLEGERAERLLAAAERLEAAGSSDLSAARLAQAEAAEESAARFLERAVEAEARVEVERAASHEARQREEAQLWADLAQREGVAA